MSLLLLLAALAAPGPDVPTAAPSELAPSYAQPPQTKDRFSRDVMEKLVGNAARLLDARDFAAARHFFEARLVDPARAGDVADMLEAFGVLAFNAADEESPERAIAVDYLRRAVAAYRTASARPADLALALNSFGDALSELYPEDPPAEADAAIEEAYRIRLAALGPRNAETAFTLADAASQQGKPSRTRGAPARIAAAAARMEEAVRLEAGASPRQPFDFLYIRFMLARLYAHNAMPTEARRVVEAFRGEIGARIAAEPVVCQTFAGKLESLAETLRDAREAPESAAVLAQAERLGRQCPQ